MLADQIRHATDAFLPMLGFPGIPSCCYKIHCCTASSMSNTLDVELKERLPIYAMHVEALLVGQCAIAWNSPKATIAIDRRDANILINLNVNSERFEGT